MRALNVLVTAGSRRVPLVQAMKAALVAAGVPGRVVVTDVTPLSPAVHVADVAYAVPFSTDPDYLAVIDRICTADDIGLIVPTIDDELPVFAASAEHFRRRGVDVAVSPLDSTLACNDKLATCTRLRAGGVAAAFTCLPQDVPDDAQYPLFVKPRFGRGSVGAFRADSRRHLDFFLDYVAEPVVQEYLTGPEFTLDVFCDEGGTPISVVPRERVVIRAGVIDRGRTSGDPALIDLALACARVFRFYAAINIQCRVVDGTPVVFEINPRFSGGIPLTIAAGADFPRLLVDSTLGRPLPVPLLPFTHGLWMTNYEAGIFFGEDRFSVLRQPPVLAPDAGLSPRRPVMPDRALIVLQARMSSKRCPGKVLADVSGRPLLQHCIERLMLAAVGPVAVATSTQPDDDAVAELARRVGARVCRGPLDDVLARFALAAAEWRGEFLIRATADNPAVDVDGAGRVLQSLEAGADYVAEIGLPVGGAVEGVRTEVLREAARVATSAYDREHVTPYVKSRPEEYRVQFPDAPSALRRPDLRFTVDTPEDLAYVRALFAATAPAGSNPSLAALIAAAGRLGGGGHS